jgi:inorganic pyrophosphatase
MPQQIGPYRANRTLNVIVESPRGSTAKFKYDHSTQLMMLSRPLPAGLVYPYDWGFVPGTRASDGDPLDVMIVWDGASYPGVLVACRPIAVLQVEQTNRSSARRERNDRILAVPSTAARTGDVHDLADLSARTRLELEHFFTAVVAFEGKDLTILGWGDREAAAEAVELATERDATRSA